MTTQQRAPRRASVPSKSQQRGTAVVVASIVLIVGVVFYLGFALATGRGSGLGKSGDYEGAGNGVQQLVQIPDGATLGSLAPELVERDIVASEDAFLTAAANNPSSNSIQPGFYRLQEKMSAEEAVSSLVNPDNKVELLDVHGGATLMDVRVVGGDVRYGIFTQISQVSCAEAKGDACATVDELQSVSANVDPAELGAPDWAVEKIRARGNDPKRIEGLIAPGQYVIDPAMSAEDVLRDLLTRSAEKYNETGIVARAEAIGLSPYDLLTAASLVEREAPAGEFDKVARVILNRLDYPMRLQFDSTVNYDLESVEVATTDEDRERITPWNTYASDGLPQTPIASPSEEAISAMENPAEGDWLYFVTVDKDGTTVFNSTLEDHMNDVQRSIDSGVLDSNR